MVRPIQAALVNTNLIQSSRRTKRRGPAGHSEPRICAVNSYTDESGKGYNSNQRANLDRLSALVQRLKPLDRQVIVCSLEDIDATSIGEITGLSPGNVAVGAG
jgi:DNA-directed RNA polymerase specialized sigma24 family protein